MRLSMITEIVEYYDNSTIIIIVSCIEILFLLYLNYMLILVNIVIDC